MAMLDWALQTMGQRLDDYAPPPTRATLRTLLTKVVNFLLKR